MLFYGRGGSWHKKGFPVIDPLLSDTSRDFDFFKTIRLVPKTTIFLPKSILRKAPCGVFIERLSLVAPFNKPTKK